MDAHDDAADDDEQRSGVVRMLAGSLVLILFAASPSGMMAARS
jgi:hypothetical protein